MSCQFLVLAGSVTVFWSESLHLSKFLVMTDTQGQCSGQTSLLWLRLDHFQSLFVFTKLNKSGH